MEAVAKEVRKVRDGVLCALIAGDYAQGLELAKQVLTGQMPYDKKHIKNHNRKQRQHTKSSTSRISRDYRVCQSVRAFV
ncbi:hypothetical protein [Helicobacter fennelliae]|uniref:hypothetical protein n=1 Tax=Helicobacter fennelliae TaxID=215 RepID=UPI0005523CEE|nr:hypothetical protein [Helicobacter fennelliae]